VDFAVLAVAIEGCEVVVPSAVGLKLELHFCLGHALEGLWVGFRRFWVRRRLVELFALI